MIILEMLNVNVLAFIYKALLLIHHLKDISCLSFALMNHSQMNYQIHLNYVSFA